MDREQLDNNCSICLATLDTYASPIADLQCGHRFHTRCIKDWEISSKKQGRFKVCPNCRRPLQYQRQFQNLDLTLSSEAHPMDLPRHLPQISDHREPQNSSQIKGGVFLMSILALVCQCVILYFYITQCGDLLTNRGEYPFFSVGSDAKGFVAIGMSAKGVIAIGIYSQGIFTLSMIGYGILAFVGQLGGGMGFGLYQVGISWYCYLGQLSISIWNTKKAQCGLNLISPLIYRERKHCQTCED